MLHFCVEAFPVATFTVFPSTMVMVIGHHVSDNGCVRDERLQIGPRRS